MKEYKFNSTKVSILTLNSPYHIELNPSEAGSRDYQVIQSIVKELASSSTILPTLQDSFSQIDVQASELEDQEDIQSLKTIPSFKIIVIHGVSDLSDNAQNALRRTMEDYSKICRFIFCCESVTSVISPLQSRCLGIRFSAPSHDSISHILVKTAKAHGFNLPHTFAQRISQSAERNLRVALLMLESCSRSPNPFSPNSQLSIPDWRSYISTVCKTISQSQSNETLLQVRTHLFELLKRCVPPTNIILAMVSNFIELCDDSILCDITEAAALYQLRLVEGRRSIFHLEAFVAKVMFLIAQQNDQSYGSFL